MTQKKMVETDMFVIMYKQILKNAKLQIGKRGKTTELTGRCPLGRQRSELDCTAIEEVDKGRGGGEEGERRRKRRRMRRRIRRRRRRKRRRRRTRRRRRMRRRRRKKRRRRSSGSMLPQTFKDYI
jgi:hypothetical protein